RRRDVHQCVHRPRIPQGGGPGAPAPQHGRARPPAEDGLYRARHRGRGTFGRSAGRWGGGPAYNQGTRRGRGAGARRPAAGAQQGRARRFVPQKEEHEGVRPTVSYPRHRSRRTRRTATLRALVRETDLAPRHLVAPLFVKEGIDDPAPIPSMPGQWQHTLESLRKEARSIAARGVLAFTLFGVPSRKDAEGSEAWNPDGISQRGLRALREEL